MARRMLFRARRIMRLYAARARELVRRACVCASMSLRKMVHGIDRSDAVSSPAVTQSPPRPGQRHAPASLPWLMEIAPHLPQTPPLPYQSKVSPSLR